MKPDCVLFQKHLEECSLCRNRLIDAVMKASTSIAGSAKTAKKAESSRENGKLGGRPRKS